MITIGSFDGVHRGHQMILDVMKKQADEVEGESILITFYPHPRMVIEPNVKFEVLSTNNEKINCLSQFGLMNMVVIPFDNSFAEMSAEEYIEYFICKNFSPHTIILGYDHRFGKGREGNIDSFRKFQDQYGYEILEIEAATIDEITISSTKIRNALKSGDIQKANDLLGYKYSIEGLVVLGKQIGRTIGFPTANIVVEEEQKLIPQNGVYLIEILLDNFTHQGLLNIGTRPTLGGTTRSIEAYILNFDRDIYGKKVKISLLQRIREEQRFENIDLLKIQLLKDRELAIDYFSKG